MQIMICVVRVEVLGEAKFMQKPVKYFLTLIVMDKTKGGKKYQDCG